MSQPGGPDPHDPRSTRERILEVAVDLFIHQGFERTSLREIAEQLGFTKAALYYHFPSKDDILDELGERVAAIGEEPMKRMADGYHPERWADLVDEVVSAMLAQRGLILMFERNRAAFLILGRGSKTASKFFEREQVFRRILADQNLPLDARVRFACSLGGIVSGVARSARQFSDVPDDVLAGHIASAIRDLLGVPNSR